MRLGAGGRQAAQSDPRNQDFANEPVHPFMSRRAGVFQRAAMRLWAEGRQAAQSDLRNQPSAARLFAPAVRGMRLLSSWGFAHRRAGIFIEMCRL